MTLSSRISSVAVIIFTACFLVFPTMDGSRAAVDMPVYLLGSGDRVKVTIFGEEDLSGQFEVSGHGMIAFPLVGEVKAVGLSLRELEEEISRKLREGFLKKPRVNAEVVNYRPFYILGEVKRPGSYPYVSGMTVINAVALGGGFTYRAQKGRMSITRANDSAKQEKRILPEDIVMPGDIIKVPERFF